MSTIHEIENLIEQLRTLSPRTKELYCKLLGRFGVYLKERDLALADASSEAWIKSLRRRGMKPQSINVAVNALKCASTQAVAAGSASFASKIRPLAFEKKPGHSRVLSLSFDQAKDLIKACRGNEPRDVRDTAIVVTGLRTGMLRSSLCALQISDITADTLTFIKKGGDPHAIQLDKSLQAAIHPWIEWLEKEGITTGGLFRSISRQRLDGSFDLFHTLTPDGLSRAVKIRAVQAGIKGFHPNTFRNTFVAWAKKAGAEPHEIAAILGTHEYRKGEAASSEAWIPGTIR